MQIEQKILRFQQQKQLRAKEKNISRNYQMRIKFRVLGRLEKYCNAKKECRLNIRKFQRLRIKKALNKLYDYYAANKKNDLLEQKGRNANYKRNAKILLG